jgi:hypothetical protein
MEENIPEGFTVFMLPYAMRTRLRTTNMLERLNREIKRRTRVASLFHNEASLLRLVSAILMETSEEWETIKKYLKLEYDLPPNQIYRKKVALSKYSNEHLNASSCFRLRCAQSGMKIYNK